MERKNEKDEIVNIEVEMIQVPENLQRRNVEESGLLSLAESINQVGLINPIVVKKIKGGYELIAGYRRYLATLRVGKRQIAARVLKGKVESLEQITLDENLEREEVNVVDEALWLAKIKEEKKMNVEELGRHVKKSKAFVSGRLAILDFYDDVVEELAAGNISLAIAKELVKCKDVDERYRMIELIKTNGATANVVRYWVQSINAQKDYEDGKECGMREAGMVEAEYERPEVFCDLCKQPTDYMNSKFVRMCALCYEVAKVNLNPTKS